VEISLPRDQESNFEPKIIAIRQRRLTEVEDLCDYPSAQGMTQREDRRAPSRKYGRRRVARAPACSGHLQGASAAFGAEMSKQTTTADHRIR
jgi:hypothetical protein